MCKYLTVANFCLLLFSSDRHSNMEDSSDNKPYMVTTSLNFKVTAPSFYNQPKKFASVAPPRPKSQTPPSGPSPTPVGTAVIGRVGDLPPPPPSLSDGICIIYAFSWDRFRFHLPSNLPSAHHCWFFFSPVLLHAELHSSQWNGMFVLGRVQYSPTVLNSLSPRLEFMTVVGRQCFDRDSFSLGMNKRDGVVNIMLKGLCLNFGWWGPNIIKLYKR